MASYGVFLAACGFEVHGPNGHIGFAPRLTPENFKAPFTTAEGWGTFEQKYQQSGLNATVSIKYGQLRLKTLSLAPGKELNPVSVQVTLNGKKVDGSLINKEDKVFITLIKDILINEGAILNVLCS